MQLENSNDKMKLRIIWILLAAAILLNIIGLIIGASQVDFYGNNGHYYYSRYINGWDVLLDVIVFLPYIVLLVEVAFIWERDKRHMGVVVYLVLQAISSGFLAAWQTGVMGIIMGILAVILWSGVAVLFCKGFQKCYFRGVIIPKYCLVFAILVTLRQFGFLYRYTDKPFLLCLFLLPSLLSVFAVYLLFDNFSFAPPFQKVDPIKNELELLQKKYELGILSEEEYQQKRQDIISRI